jgi:site-specific recombinase XerD
LWIADGKAQGLSPATLRERRQTLARFAWWLEHEEGLPLALASLTPLVMRRFLAYSRECNPLGRWGSDRAVALREARPGTVRAYYRTVRSFLVFTRAEGLLAAPWPLENVKAPKVPRDQIEPFSAEQLQRLVNAARGSHTAERDVAVILVLVDSGMRASELCGLCRRDAERGSAELRVVGKGNKERTVYLGVAARRALGRYIELERPGAGPDEPLFIGIGGKTPGGPLTRRGVHQIVARAGKAAGIDGVRCSPHTLRHTFAINYLRAGGNVFELQQLMGHEDLETLQKYVKLAQVDLAQGHRQASPADRMKLR